MYVITYACYAITYALDFELSDFPAFFNFSLSYIPVRKIRAISE